MAKGYYLPLSSILFNTIQSPTFHSLNINSHILPPPPHLANFIYTLQFVTFVYVVDQTRVAGHAEPHVAGDRARGHLHRQLQVHVLEYSYNQGFLREAANKKSSL